MGNTRVVGPVFTAIGWEGAGGGADHGDCKLGGSVRADGELLLREPGSPSAVCQVGCRLVRRVGGGTAWLLGALPALWKLMGGGM